MGPCVATPPDTRREPVAACRSMPLPVDADWLAERPEQVLWFSKVVGEWIRRVTGTAPFDDAAGNKGAARRIHTLLLSRAAENPFGDLPLGQSWNIFDQLADDLDQRHPAFQCQLERPRTPPSGETLR